MSHDTINLDQIYADSFGILQDVIDNHASRLEVQEIGYVTEIGQGVARVSGLPSVCADELLHFTGDRFGLAFNLWKDEIGCILLDKAGSLHAGSEVRRTQRVFDIPVGADLLGRVIDPLGRPLDQRGTIAAEARRTVERDAPDIMSRAPVTVPLQTGLKVIDALLPIGRGQRELILGDRQTGKTSIAIDTILNQSTANVLCIYCAIGQRSEAVARVIETLRKHGALDYSIVMVASADAPAGIQYVSPYAATAIGEFFMEQGRDVLIVYDDLTTHARAYRELSLLLRRPPGREAFPGDIFYVHSRLLERSTHLNDEHGGGSLTALPIAATEAQNVSAYIPTNLISITDGQIYLSPNLFRKGILPAVDVGRSVSRVGGKTQLPAYRTVAGNLRLSYSQFEELEKFARFSSQLDAETRRILQHGQRVRATLKQPLNAPLPVANQLAELVAVTGNVFAQVPLPEIGEAGLAVQGAITDALPELCDAMQAGEPLSEDQLRLLQDTALSTISELYSESAAHGVT